MTGYTLRDVRFKDRDWLWKLRIATMRSYVEQTWGKWDDAEQQKYFLLTLSAAAIRIIVDESSRDIGLLHLERRGSELYLSTIEIAPEFQRQGLGTRVLQDIQAEGRKTGKPVRLQTLRVNPARRLYQRLGFVEIGETDTHVLLDWKP